MPLSPNRKLVQVTTPAYLRMKKIVKAMKKNGVPTNGSYWLSILILAQDVPTNGNNHQPSAPVTAPVPCEEEKQ